jgi:hypothetical protein
MNNKEFEVHVRKAINPYLGYYRNGNIQKPAYCFGSGTREGDVSGLEIIQIPAGRTRKRVLTSSYVTSHGLQLIQHEGKLTIYEAESKLFKMAVSLGAADVVSKPIYPDTTQNLLPGFLFMAYFLIDDCCEGSGC